jgi:hypothetical protein
VQLPARLSKRRKMLAFAIAAISDALSIGATLAPPLEWAIDGTTAILLFVVMGFRWAFLPALVFEAIPIVSVFPTWTLVVGALIALERREN